MIDVLIIDDEIWVCQLIRKIVDWEEIGFCIVGEAHDGYEALDLIRRKRPKLVLTDIRMPGYDGVELIRRTREQGLDTQFIIVSGYGDFTYAQEALKYGALGYILKPIDQEELLDFLKKTREKIFSVDTEEKAKQELRTRLDTSLWQLREQYFLRLFEEEGKSALLPAQVLNEQLGCRFGDGVFQVLLYQLDRKYDASQAYEVNEIMLTSLCRYVTAVFGEDCYESFTFFRGQRLLQILNYPAKAKERVRRKQEQLRKRINDEQRLEIGYELTIGAGSCENGTENLGGSFQSARDSLRMRLRFGFGGFVDGSRYRFAVTGLSSVFTVEDEKKVEGYVKSYDVEGANAFMEQLFGRLLADEQVSPVLIFETAGEIASLLKGILKRSQPAGREWTDPWRNIEDRLENCYQVPQIIKILGDMFREARQTYELGNKSRNDKVIEIAKRYIVEHYKEEITLKALADEVCLNPKYFGELFKKETGMNYSDYLIRHRMEMAEYLLKDVRYRVNEVGCLVGYKDPKYFSKLFKKMTGLSPAQYRKMFS
ncbi:MAG: response regulator transcription factor [Blautia sp.]